MVGARGPHGGHLNGRTVTSQTPWPCSSLPHLVEVGELNSVRRPHYVPRPLPVTPAYLPMIFIHLVRSLPHSWTGATPRMQNPQRTCIRNPRGNRMLASCNTPSGISPISFSFALNRLLQSVSPPSHGVLLKTRDTGLPPITSTQTRSSSQPHRNNPRGCL